MVASGGLSGCRNTSMEESKALTNRRKGDFLRTMFRCVKMSRNVLESTPLVHMVTSTLTVDPKSSLVWVGVEGDEVVVGSQAKRRKIHNLLRDDRVALSMLTGGWWAGPEEH